MSNNLVKDKKLEPKTKAFIVEAIREVLEDSDFGLELSDRAKKRLSSASRSSRKLTPLSEIKNKYY